MKDKDCTGHFSQGFLFMRKEKLRSKTLMFPIEASVCIIKKPR